MDKIYPKHCKALRIANIAPKKFPKLKNAIKELEARKIKKLKSKSNNNKKKKKKARSRQTYFCVGVSCIWRNNPIHSILKKLRNKYNLKWLRISMSYHKFANLREKFQGDLNNKLMTGINSEDFIDRDCNCNATTLVDGKCAFNGECRKCILVYKATCKICDKFYIGNTQQLLKKRMGQHFSETRRQINTSKSSDSFSAHFSSHFQRNDTSINVQHIRRIVNMKILWQGNAISCMKSFCTNGCSLCMKERLTILDMMKKQPDMIINTNNELFGACRHKTRFHKYTNTNNPRTDDEPSSERALGTP